MATITSLKTLKINYLTQAQYDAAVANGTINSDELYLTPSDMSGLAYLPLAGGTMTGPVQLVSYTGAGFYGRNISYGTAAPSGGSNGDIYIQYT